VFSLTYRRYVDLKNAEAQAREAQVEASLERVRAKAMAMHSTHDISDATAIVFNELTRLNVEMERSGIVILNDKSTVAEVWSTPLSVKNQLVTKVITGELDCNIHPMLQQGYLAWKNKDDYFKYSLVGQDLLDYYDKLQRVPGYRFPKIKEYPEQQVAHCYFFDEGYIFAYTRKELANEEKQIFHRFTNVFSLTYRRYVDLKKAEAQAREAQIEASLERVRAQAMAMQHSDDLENSTTILFEELEKLELSVERSGIGIFDEATRDCHLWTTVVTAQGEKQLATGITKLTVHPLLLNTFNAWKSQESLLYVLEGQELKDYYNLVSKSEFHLPEEVIQNSTGLLKEYYFYTPFGAGGIYVFSGSEPNDKEIKILRRFAEVFHLTYTRYEDLQKAEERAKEATKQASLDRVRGEIASMRSIDDLTRITPLIWQELKTLNIPFIRCGVLIMDVKRKVIETHLSDPDGHPLGVFDLPFNSRQIAVGALKNWEKGTIYKDHWDRDQFNKFTQNLLKAGQIESPETYQGAEAPPESLNLHFLPFKQGMLYVGNTEPLNNADLQTAQSLANTFSIAYTRFEDFNQLEKANKQIQHALDELKSTQTQLIHSEKMASLGELTAGIAHEIQNPLNFVNNFSEVSTDLIEELLEEIKEGNLDEVKELTEDIRQNLEKINHHGKRASSIVKGMLEHSRSGSPQKEPTDINLLADEYLRLAYHGFRAKDKSFSANYKLDLDESLPKISVISQDIGRVLLNLINNAFYAVSVKAKNEIEGYKPEVLVRTKKRDMTVEIVVRDNGGGIPPNVVDKIFQPFFTTKPTGKGTGLGLSLSYDIITKGHDGHLEVETHEGIGTAFIITLKI
jgi:signal transduction histidine kinase